MPKMLDEKDHYGFIRDPGNPFRKYHQHGLYYGADKVLLWTPEAKEKGYTENDCKVDFVRTDALQVDVKDKSIPDVQEEDEKASAGLTTDSFKPVSEKKYIISKSGKPYKTEDAGWAMMKRKKLTQSKHDVVPYKDGWAIVEL